jgi:hypothetical protein
MQVRTENVAKYLDNKLTGRHTHVNKLHSTAHTIYIVVAPCILAAVYPVYNQQTARCNNKEDHNINSHHRECLKFYYFIETNSSLAGQDVPCLLRNLEVR